MDARRPLTILGLALGAVLAFAAAPALAQTYSATITNADLGKIVDAPSSSTSFTFDASSGNVGQSGSADRITTGTVRAEVDFDCTGKGNDCGSNMDVQIRSSGSVTGKISAITNFTVSAINRATIGTVTGTDPITFTISDITKNNQPKLYIGATVTINGGSQSGAYGNAAAGFTVLAAKSGAIPVPVASGSVTAVVDRPIAFSGTTSMEFGTIYNPTSGTSTVTLDPNAASHPVSVTGNAIALPTPTPQRATYHVTGEGGQTFSTTLSALTLSNGANSIPVTLTTSTLPTTLSSTPGNEGTATFYVGGHFDITPSTHGHTYTGSYNVTVAYN